MRSTTRLSVSDDAASRSYTCALYAHREDEARWLFVCERDPAPIVLGPVNWRLVAHGVEPPEKAKHWLKLNRFYQWFQDSSAERALSSSEVS